MNSSEPVRLFVLCTGWGIPFPTSAPFPLKLATWMRMAGINFEFVVENNAGKGPKGKSPWIEHNGTRLGDSSLIIDYLREEFAVRDFDAGLTPEQRALSVVVQRALEEHFHQCFEHQLFLGQGGEARLRELAEQMPPVVRALLPKLLVRQLSKQLHARGMGRHSESVIVEQGIADLDALALLLGDKPYFHGDEPTSIDACVFGFLATCVYVDGDNPLYRHAANSPQLMDYCERMRARYYPETLGDSTEDERRRAA